MSTLTICPETSYPSYMVSYYIIRVTLLGQTLHPIGVQPLMTSDNQYMN